MVGQTCSSHAALQMKAQCDKWLNQIDGESSEILLDIEGACIEVGEGQIKIKLNHDTLFITPRRRRRWGLSKRFISFYRTTLTKVPFFEFEASSTRPFNVSTAVIKNILCCPVSRYHVWSANVSPTTDEWTGKWHKVKE